MSFSDVAVGKDSEDLLATCRKVFGGLERTETIHSKVQIWMDLYKILAEYSSENWDGEGAVAISEKAIIEALRFVKNLPTYVVGLPLPEITADNDGEISLEWYKNNREVFVVSISGKNRIAYAGLFGTNDIHGTEFFGESIPPIVLINLQRLFS
jgi:hypothetical protein